MFDEILADCLEALAEGATIRDCLTRYPAEAATLEPLLRLAVALGREGETRLSPGAFGQGRRLLRHAAQAHQAQRKQKSSIGHRQPRYAPLTTAQRRTPFPPYQQPILQNGRPLSTRAANTGPTRWQPKLPRLLRVAIVLLTLVSATTFIRLVATSLPGTWLYPLKNSSEQMVGVLMTVAGEVGLATPTPFEEVTVIAVTATTATPIPTSTMTPTISATATPTVTPTALLLPSATAPAAPILEPSPTATPTLAPVTEIPVAPSPTVPPTPLPEITVQIPRQESSEQEKDEHKKNEEASGAEAPMATSTPEATQSGVESITPVMGTGPEEGTPTPMSLSTEATAMPTAADQTPTVTSGEGVWLPPTRSVVPATATPEAVVTNTPRPTNQVNPTKTPKVAATQVPTEPATPNAPTAAPATTTAPLTPVEKTPNATAQPSVATKEAATETPVAASPTPRVTTSSGEATKMPQP